jgi:uncharacterized protein DUF6894
MPQFFFDLRNGRILERDEFGLDLPDFETAYLEAHRAAIDIWSEARREGRTPAYRCFEIRDSLGRMVIELPFTEALDVPTESPTPRWRPRPVMDEPAKAELHKTQADLALGERHISSQRARIARLEQNGSDAALARELLKTFLQIQQLHQDRHNQLQRELASGAT